MNKLYNIYAKIEGIKYNVNLKKELKKIDFIKFDINKCPSSFILNIGDNSFGVSKWLSPKRTRSYPYSRIYDTLYTTKRIAIIPLVKDEGIDGDRDFLQWDTISLMSLLDIYVILCYYDHAVKHPKNKNKIKVKRLNNELIIKKIKEINNYKSSALHWNLNEVKQIPELVNEIIEVNKQISQQTGAKIHDEEGLIKYKNQFLENIKNFIEYSRAKAKSAQKSEVKTTHKLESLNLFTKSSIIIKNYLGGEYYFTVDEVEIKDNEIMLIETKNTTKSLLPSLGDIKDGLIKMVLYSNFKEIYVNNKKFNFKAILRLTSNNIKNYISTDDLKKFSEFCTKNNFSVKQIEFLTKLFDESRLNNFVVEIRNA